MTARTYAAQVQRRRVYRWVAAVGLLASAEEQRGSDTPETNAMGLMGAHAACEAMLGLLAGTKPYPASKPQHHPAFPVMLDHVAKRSRLPAGLRDDLAVMHDVRNSFVHGGMNVDAGELDRAIDAAHSLAEHVRLPGNRRLVGVPTVVADIIEIEAIGVWLRHADDMRSKRRLRLSADGIARALDAAILRTDPSLRAGSGRPLRLRT